MINIVVLCVVGKWMDDHSSKHWSLDLASIIFHINTRTTRITKKTPYRSVFGLHPRTNVQY